MRNDQRRKSVFWLLPLALLALVLLACQLHPLSSRPIVIPTLVFPTAPPPSPTVFPTPIPTPTPTPGPDDLHLAPEDIFVYPAPGLYAGDMVTFDIAPQGLGEIEPQTVTVEISRLVGGVPAEIVELGLGYPAFDGVPRARPVWTWDTTGLQGDQMLRVWVDPDDRIQVGDEDPANNVVTLTLEIQPAAERPALEVGAEWIATTTDCCVFHYLTGTAAERDIDLIVQQTEDAIDHVEAELQATLSEEFEVYLIDRVIGHGGYAYRWFVLSYLDRHYAGREMEQVMRHEATHVLDSASVADRWAPTILREGLAVMVAGGHFKPEPIPERAAALLELGWYIPLQELADDFYRHQHEIGYLEAAAFVTYLVETHGWEDYVAFYRSIDPEDGPAPEALSAALERSFGADLDKMEEAFLDWLAAQPSSPAHARDLENTVRIFDTIRQYQQVYEPGAYFWSGWLPDPAAGEAHGITADFMRHPREPENVALETMLIAAQDGLVVQDFEHTEALLDAIDDVLARGGVFAHPLAVNYLRIVQTVEDGGFEAQSITLTGAVARVEATAAESPALIELTLSHVEAGWSLTD
jgi:hypothetical protein